MNCQYCRDRFHEKAWDVGAVGVGRSNAAPWLRQVLFQTLASTATSGSAPNKLLSAGTNETMEHEITWHNAMKSHTERGTKMYRILMDRHLLLVHKSGKNDI